jgi:predicted transcriptional regulator
MIYFESSLNVLNLFTNANTKLSQEQISSKSSLKSNEVKQLLSYLLFYGYIDYTNNQYFLTDIGFKYAKCFNEHQSDTLNILKKLSSQFPNSLTKKDCSGNLSSVVFKDIIFCLKEQGYVDMVDTVTSYEMVRISQKGFLLLDYFAVKQKINQLLD